MAQAQRRIAEGYGFVVDLDLEKFFDRVNHDSLMARVAAGVSDKRALKLIRAFLNAGAMEGGLVRPQGGPLAPLLSNLMLDDLDKELADAAPAFAVTRMTATSMFAAAADYPRRVPHSSALAPQPDGLCRLAVFPAATRSRPYRNLEGSESLAGRDLRRGSWTKTDIHALIAGVQHTPIPAYPLQRHEP